MINKLKTNNKVLFKIDRSLDNLIDKIELLNYVNPINIEQEKHKFFKSKYLTNPIFEYPQKDFDKFKIHQKIFNQPIELIEDEKIRKLYEQTIYYYSGLVRCIETIGEDKKFYYNSLQLFGTPTEQDVENAKFILHFEEESSSNSVFKPQYTPKQAEKFFKNYANRYDFKFNITQSSAISAIAMVVNYTQTLVLNSKHRFTENEIAILTHHEIGVHMLTTFNGLQHNLKIFSHGLPDNVETQEGLAVFSEYMSGNLTIRRLKELAYRVIAVDSLAKGYSFSRTFRLLHNTYDLDKAQAFYITTRVHRAGGFTKDYLYLTGLKKVYNFYKLNKNLEILLTGKVSLKYVNYIQHLIDKGLAVNSRFRTDIYAKNKNTNKTVNFILDNLK
ncbi:MAG: flavohemoglobin expression-modulating QEGLA motif protein [Tenacibaculum sp.]